MKAYIYGFIIAALDNTTFRFVLSSKGFSYWFFFCTKSFFCSLSTYTFPHCGLYIVGVIRRAVWVEKIRDDIGIPRTCWVMSLVVNLEFEVGKVKVPKFGTKRILELISWIVIWLNRFRYLKLTRIKKKKRVRKSVWRRTNS